MLPFLLPYYYIILHLSTLFVILLALFCKCNIILIFTENIIFVIMVLEVSAMAIGKNILKFRTEKGLTQKEFSSMCGFSQAALNLWENEKRKPKMEQIQKIANTFQCNVSDIINYDTNTSVPNGSEIDCKNRLSKNIKLTPIDLVLDITKENYEKYTEYFNTGFSEIKEIICNERNAEMISIETGKKLEQNDLEEIFDSLTTENKLTIFRDLVKDFIITPIFHTISINLKPDAFKNLPDEPPHE